MTRFRFPLAAILLLFSASFLFAQDTRFPPDGEQIPGPDGAKTDAGQCCYRSGEMQDSAGGFKTWIDDISIGDTSA